VLLNSLKQNFSCSLFISSSRLLICETMRSTMKRRNYNYGDKVEVCSKEEGFVGSYFEATIVSCLFNGQYLVRYKNLMQDDKSGLLLETVYLYEIRPLPSRVHSPKEFQLNQKVDAFDNDGWWLGQIASEKIITEEGHYYKVHFDTTYETICYPSDRIRVHHDWFDGEWIIEA